MKELRDQEDPFEKELRDNGVVVGGYDGHRFEKVVGGHEPVQSDPCA